MGWGDETPNLETTKEGRVIGTHLWLNQPQRRYTFSLYVNEIYSMYSAVS